jgi:hypothetical protein
MTPYHNSRDCNMQMNRTFREKVMLQSVQIGILISCTILQNAKGNYTEEKHILMLENEIKLLTSENRQRTFSCLLHINFIHAA